MQIHLAGIPVPIPGESLVSWMQRVCQVYDLTYARFHTIFGTRPRVDLDMCMRSDDFARVAAMGGIPKECFNFIEHSFGRLMQEKNLQCLLARHQDGKAKYRFCPSCWRRDQHPYLRLEWRFKIWRYCPTHWTKMRTECPYCNRPLAMHRSVLGGTRNPAPVQNLSICLYCRKDLRRSKDLQLDVDDLRKLRRCVVIQQDVISSILQGYVSTGSRRNKYPLHTIFGVLKLDYHEDRQVFVHEGRDI